MSYGYITSEEPRSRKLMVVRTYWFIKLVLPTPLSPSMMTCSLQYLLVSNQTHVALTFSKIFFREDMVVVVEWPR